MTCDTQTIITDSICYDCVVKQGLFLPAFAYLLCKTAAGVKVNCDPATLANDARCFLCEIPEGLLGAAILSLLCQLNAKGGGGGATCIVCGEGDPTDLPPCDCSLYVNTLNENLWRSSDGITWHPIIYGP